MRHSALKARWCTGCNQFTGLVAGISKLVRLITAKIVGVTGSQHLRLIRDRHVETTIQDDAALLALMRHRMLARPSGWLVTLLEKLNRPVVQIRADLQV